MKCVILQPSYIPWRGYFHQIQKADVFVFYDDVQYDRRGWRNRNRIKHANGSQWLTIPVLNKGVQQNHTPINAIRINWDRRWNESHWATIQHAYGKAPYFRDYRELLQDFYQRHPQFLADFTIDMTIGLAEALGLTHTRYVRASSLPIHGQKTDRLLRILKHLGATHYISGPSAKEYVVEHKFQEAGITIEYMVYDYPEYPQLQPPFDPQVSILDLLVMTGPEASRYIWESPVLSASR